jgi:D-sedoheptulose 7-phosphate isomerase
MQEKISHSLNESMKALEQLKTPSSLRWIEEVSLEIAKTYLNEGKVLIAGNGGSLCDAMHFAEELTGYFRKDRPALPAIALADPGHITCVGNDTHFNFIFSRSIEALGKPLDLFIALSTSGNSKNILEAIKAAKKLNIKTVALLGKEGGAIKGLADFELIIEGVKTSDRIQEAHMTLLHILVELVEEHLFAVKA